MAAASRLTVAQKEKPDQGGRATKSNQNDTIVKRRAREVLADRKPIAVPWPRDGKDSRGLRDEWMRGAHADFCDDLIALRLLWPIFDAIYIDSGVALISNRKLAKLTGKSISVVKLGLGRIRRRGWIAQDESIQSGEGRPHTSRRMRAAFPEGFSREKAASADHEGVQPLHRGGAGPAPGGVQRTGHNTLSSPGHTPEKNPPIGGPSSNEDSRDTSSTIITKKSPSVLSEDEDIHIAYLAAEHPIKESEIAKFRQGGAPREHAINCLVKVWIKRHLCDGFDDEPDAQFLKMEKSRKAAISDLLRACILEDAA